MNRKTIAVLSTLIMIAGIYSRAHGQPPPENQAAPKWSMELGMGANYWHLNGLYKVMNQWVAVDTSGDNYYESGRTDVPLSYSAQVHYRHARWRFSLGWNSISSRASMYNFDPAGLGWVLRVKPTYAYASVGAAFVWIDNEKFQASSGLSVNVGTFRWRYPNYYISPYGHQAFHGPGWPALAGTVFTDLRYGRRISIGLRLRAQFPLFLVNPGSHLQDPLLLREHEIAEDQLNSRPLNAGIELFLTFPFLNKLIGGQGS